jgi:hypothetical protein
VKLTTETAPVVNSFTNTLNNSLASSLNTSLKQQRAFTFEVICANPQVHWQVEYACMLRRMSFVLVYSE